MNGNNYLLDSNFIIGYLKSSPPVVDFLAKHQITLHQCSYSFITRIELLGYHKITMAERAQIEIILYQMQYLGWASYLEEETIALKQKYNLKLPDTMILATAQFHNLELLTLDHKLKKALH